MIIAVDFDGTCVDHRYPDIGATAPSAVKVMKALVDKGNQLILWTMRSGDELEESLRWFAIHDIQLYGAQTNPTQAAWTASPKCYAHVYIDDAAFGAPVIHPEGFSRPCIDWRIVHAVLVKGRASAAALLDAD
jgi:hypothetical protein